MLVALGGTSMEATDPTRCIENHLRRQNRGNCIGIKCRLPRKVSSALWHGIYFLLESMTENIVILDGEPSPCFVALSPTF